MTYYTAPSGAGVFSVGTNRWLTRLVPPTFPSSEHDPLVVQITENLLTAFGEGPAGKQHPSSANHDTIAERFGTSNGNPYASD